MHKVNMKNIEEIMCYSDIYLGELPVLSDEIKKMNMNKAISIVCELIKTRKYTIETRTEFLIWEMNFKIPFEMALKKICGISPENPEMMRADVRLVKSKHIVSLQGMLILLKNILIYGDKNTLTQTDYSIDINDYVAVIKMNLIVAEMMNKADKEQFDPGHFVYSSIHLNDEKNIAAEVLRMYYMLCVQGCDINNFEEDVRREYRDYCSDFEKRYGYSIIQYISIFFWELSNYLPPANALVQRSLWERVEDKFGRLSIVANKVFADLSSDVECFYEWARETKDNMWDFSKFLEFPLVSDGIGNYISISDWTLYNIFFEKLFWKVRECYPQNDSRAMSFFGRLFEKYLQDIIKNSANKANIDYIPEFKFGKDNAKSSDAYIRIGKNLIVVEMKGFSAYIDVMM